MPGIHIRTTSTGTNASTIGPDLCVTSKHRNGPRAACVISATTKSAASSAARMHAIPLRKRKARCEPALCEVLSTPFGAGADSESADGRVRRSRPTRVRAADGRVWRSRPARVAEPTGCGAPQHMDGAAQIGRDDNRQTDRQTDRQPVSNRAGAAGGTRGPLPPRLPLRPPS